MYEIRCIVGDKKLREVLVFLHNNNTLEPPVVIPTGDINATEAVKPVHSLHEDLSKAVFPKKQKTTAKRRQRTPIQHGGRHLKGQGATSVVRNLIARTGVSKISAREMKEATMAQGYSPGAYSHAIKLLLADKTIRRTAEEGHYAVTSTTQKAVIQHEAGNEVRVVEAGTV